MSGKRLRAAIRIAGLTLLLTTIGSFILWDYSNVVHDFSSLKALLRDTRNRAISENETIITRFDGKQVITMDGKNGVVLQTINMPTLSQVNYDTTLGENMIVFNGHGTSDFNKRVHGGDIRLRSWLGFTRNIAVNCTGLVTEGVYPSE